ncbi:hypothetical protein B5X24_HaOG214190 [Helicoverpa armigera]|nr:hypothetical protein B5X24_HaOG214190 [Helicoverpa armigera]
MFQLHLYNTERILTGCTLYESFMSDKPEMRLVCEERSELTAIVQSQQRDIAALQQDSAQNKKCPTCGVATPEGADDDDQSSKPTFSVRELRAILHERNELKLKLSRAEEQLHALQADQHHDSGSDTSPSVSTGAGEEEEAPVQGPLPAEPDDAPWKRNSGIRKLCMIYEIYLYIAPAACSGWRWRLDRRKEQRDRRESLSALGIEDVFVGVFASSLLSLISPWAPSSVATRAPPPPPTPRPPPHPRRHSHPHAPPTSRQPASRRRYSEHPPSSKLDLRQELLDLNLGTQEFDSWLGNKFEENDEFETGPYDPRFVHDIPLQRSISLDRGIDIFNHLQAIGSETSVSSLWTVDSDGRDSLTDRYRSFEDIPTSPYRARSRSASFGVETFSERDLALAVLNESYKGLDAPSGSVSPQVRKLQRCFTFAGSFDSIKDRGPVEVNEKKIKPKLRLMIPNRRNSTSCPVSPEISRLRSFFPSTAAGDTNISDDEDQVFEVQEPVYRSMSIEWSQEESKVKQRRSGLQAVTTDLRKKVLVKQGFKSCENLERNQGSQLAKTSKYLNSNFATLSRTASFSGNTDSVTFDTLPTIIISPADSGGVANISNTSNYVEISRNCDCRICREGEGKYVLRSALSKLFVKIVSCKSRKLYWDENNNLNDSEMYKCVMHVLKLMLGLWLRHLDHN